ncbi:hypothetical protein BC938DRAFT_476628 [Jimgerdemannia flammicorona]|uniref:Uncharacterized protein n=1 Tax=Jimgerdemannia flammicorona TaxID=994334 RepID=A0A433PFK8_9FUNG|nr:hypothetical protein BC938DRAFT_476628 [Jimgerdemannia flammicorona]
MLGSGLGWVGFWCSLESLEPAPKRNLAMLLDHTFCALICRLLRLTSTKCLLIWTVPPTHQSSQPRPPLFLLHQELVGTYNSEHMKGLPTQPGQPFLPHG